jgi:hypothetical protein
LPAPPADTSQRQPKAKAALAAAATAKVTPCDLANDEVDEEKANDKDDEEKAVDKVDKEKANDKVDKEKADDKADEERSPNHKSSRPRDKTISPPKRRQSNNKSPPYGFDYEEDEDKESRSRSTDKAKGEAKTKPTGHNPNNAPECRFLKIHGIKVDAMTPVCTLKHALSFSRVVSLELQVQPVCDDCLIPISANDVCSVCFRCEPLHLLCTKCTFAKTVERVQIH